MTLPERKYVVGRLGRNPISASDKVLPRSGYVGKVVRRMKNADAQAFEMTSGNAPFSTRIAAQYWVEEIVENQVGMEIPMSCLWGIVSYGPLIAIKRDVLVVNVDALTPVCTYGYDGASMSWREI